MSYTYSTGPAMIEKADLEVLRKELFDYQTCVKGNERRFMALTDVRIVCGSQLDGECCRPISPEVLEHVLHTAALFVIGGMPIKGGKNNWSTGFMGSRWFDLDGSRWGLDYVRCAFYSKKHAKFEWKSDKPYIIRITAEKAR